MLPPLKPGFYSSEQCPGEIYHMMQAASATYLKTLATSTPAHLLDKIDNTSAPTPALIFGTQVDEAIADYPAFARRYVCAMQCSATTSKKSQCTRTGSTRIDGMWLCSQHTPEGATPDDISIITPDDLERVEGCRASLLRHPVASLIIANGTKQRTAIWDDYDIAGVTCRARADFEVPAINALADLKTTVDASPEGFRNAIARFRYDIQASHYTSGWNALGAKIDKFLFVCVEKTPPFAVAVYQISDKILSAARQEITGLLMTWRECNRTDTWPAYSDNIIKIKDLPAWVGREEEAEIA